MEIRLCKPEHPSGHVVWIHENDPSELWDLLNDTGVTLICVTDADWNRDLSPWKAEKVFRGADFTGNAPEHLKELRKHLNETEESLGYPVTRRTIAGYSLAGLFALWSAGVTDSFDSVVSASGSLWFDGFTEFLGANRIHADAVYLSLGDAEHKAKNPRMARVEDCTRECCEILTEHGIPCIFEKNSGGHFTDPAGRLARGIRWIDERT